LKSCNENNTFYPVTSSNLNVLTTFFLFAIQLSSGFYKVQISSHYGEIILKCVPSIAVNRSATTLPVVREITRIKKV
jgi:hypothetical protein